MNVALAPPCNIVIQLIFILFQVIFKKNKKVLVLVNENLWQNIYFVY